MSEILDIAAALSRLLKAENILLICHKNPDGDTLGSAAALYHALKGLGKTAAVLCADPIPARYGYMDIGLFTGQFTPGYTVAVDVAGIQLFGDAVAAYTKSVDLCIDHHPSNAGYADCGGDRDHAHPCGLPIHRAFHGHGLLPLFQHNGAHARHCRQADRRGREPC